MSFESIIAWNTGCRYTAAGQRIAAGITRDRQVYFVDTDRMIGGMLFDHWNGALAQLNPEWVHNRYLRNEYQSILVSSIEWKVLKQCALSIEDNEE